MTIDLPTLFQLGVTLVGAAAVLFIWFLVYIFWKTEVQPLTQGLRWRKVGETPQGYSVMDWADPKENKGGYPTDADGGVW